MQITLGGTVLADDANNRAVSSWAQDATPSASVLKWGGPEVDAGDVELAVQTSQPIGAKHVNLYGRGNASGTLRFSTCLRTSTLAQASEALVWWQNHFTSSGTLAIDGHGMGEGKVHKLSLRRTGVTVYATYEILHETTRS